MHGIIVSSDGKKGLLSGPPSLFTATTKRSWSSCVQRRRSLAVAEPREREEPMAQLLGSERPKPWACKEEDYSREGCKKDKTQRINQGGDVN